MQIGPEHLAVDAIGRVQHVVMVVPVDADEHEAEHVGQEYRNQRPQGVPRHLVRDVELEHHDRDEDGDNAVAERLETSLCHQWIRY